ncbi:LysR substrate-binding domain-containing protein [Rhizobium straminoryzae]|uniref:LysR family transcriptional regulator n=1 Tax=Rhizobium straminoryzae TaxID=1387186 RepID=A0A549THE7_9HYPH|nr:LysR substrate-binding domain-containing protein [Rhizobium straminoryzae]TRL42442.1 LysR family transcriptional regulator [Rhizobium straminoryzae]
MNGLDDMYLFRKVVECGGISAAARRLGVAKSTLARRVGELETRLGLPLYHRDSRRFGLTNFGAECYQHCVRLANEADKVLALAERARAYPTGVLHVVCPPVIGTAIVDALAVEFAASVPDVRLHLEETMGIFDPRETMADFAIYPSFTPLADTSLVARKIMTAPYILAARPDVLEGRAIPKSPEELQGLRCIGLGSRGTEWKWRFRKGRHVQTHRFAPVFTTTLPSALLSAARQGLGIASLPVALCRRPFDEKQLIPLLEDWAPDPVTIYAVYPSSNALSNAARQFLNLLLERLPKLMSA